MLQVITPAAAMGYLQLQKLMTIDHKKTFFFFLPYKIIPLPLHPNSKKGILKLFAYVTTNQN